MRNAGYESSGDWSLLRIFWRRRVVVAVCVVAALFIACAYLAAVPTVYNATSHVLVERIARPEPSGRLSLAGDEGYLRKQCALIKSTPIVATALGTLDSSTLKSIGDSTRPTAWLSRRLTAEPADNQSITVGLASADPEEAVRIVDAVVSAYQNYQESISHRGVTTVVDVLDKQKQEAKAELAKVQQDILEVHRTSDIVPVGPGSAAETDSGPGQLADDLARAHTETMKTRAALESACLSAGLDPDAAEPELEGMILTAREEDSVRQQLLAAQQVLGERRKSYGPSHPRVKEQSAIVEHLERTYAGSARARWRAAASHEKELQQALEQQQKLAMERRAAAARLDQLEANEKRLLTQCESLDSQIQQAAMQANAAAVTVTVLDQAEYKDNPILPDRQKVLVGSALLGLLLGLGVGILRERTDPRLRDSNEVKAALGLPVLAEIPIVTGNTSRQALGWAVHLNPVSSMADAYRSLRSGIQFGLSEWKLHTLVVTSATIGEGKSTLASNLAIALAQGGRRILLVDGDLRSPSQASIFGLSGSVGFSSVLQAGELVEGAIRRTTMNGLHVMPAGPDVSNPADLLNSPALASVLDLLGSRYDYTIIDSPPLARSDDARILAAHADGALLVVRAEQSNRRRAEDARDALLSVGARIVGVVLNGSNGMPGGFSSPGRYGRQPMGPVFDPNAPFNFPAAAAPNSSGQASAQFPSPRAADIGTTSQPASLKRPPIREPASDEVEQLSGF